MPRLVVDRADRAVPPERDARVVEDDVDLLLDAVEVSEVLVQIQKRLSVRHVQAHDFVRDVVHLKASQEVEAVFRVPARGDDVPAAAVVTPPDPRQVLLDELEADPAAGARDEHAQRLVALLSHHHGAVDVCLSIDPIHELIHGR